jgi:hypothetical protein
MSHPITARLLRLLNRSTKAEPPVVRGAPRALPPELCTYWACAILGDCNDPGSQVLRLRLASQRYPDGIDDLRFKVHASVALTYGERTANERIRQLDSWVEGFRESTASSP